jgi:hypothetical protein
VLREEFDVQVGKLGLVGSFAPRDENFNLEFMVFEFHSIESLDAFLGIFFVIELHVAVVDLVGAGVFKFEPA